MGTVVSTWFVSDTKDNATIFPQVGDNSANPEFQAVYWRCIVCFFATSVLQNPEAIHIFFTNAGIPDIDGLSIKNLFIKWGVEVVLLPITYRLPPEVAKSWGNQFYILDIIKYLSLKGKSCRYMVFDNDCVWNGSAEKLIKAIDQYGCLTYTMGFDDYAANTPINGLTRSQLAQALLSWKPESKAAIANYGIDYHGGEIFAATHTELIKLVELAEELWQWKIDKGSGFLEEGHFLSILYSACQYQKYTATPYLKRMWTNFKFNNINKNDLNLDVWHLPSEKKSGFAHLFKILIENDFVSSPKELNSLLAKTMGIPQRNLRKFFRDMSMKIAEKIKLLLKHRQVSS